jgi:hypothetical protein
MHKRNRARQAIKTENPEGTVHEALEIEQHISSPYLPSTEIHGYELEIPGSGRELLDVSHEVIRAEIMLKNSVVSARHRELDIAEKALDAQIANANKHHNNFRWSLFASSLLAFVALGLSSFLAMHDKDWVAGIMLGTIAGILAWLAYKDNKKKSNASQSESD